MKKFNLVNYSSLSLKLSLVFLAIVFDVDDVKFYVQKLALTKEFFLDFLANFTDPRSFTIVKAAIVEYQLDVLNELAHVLILVCF